MEEKKDAAFSTTNIPERISFPGVEEEVLAFWKQIDAFQTSLKRSEGKPEFSFFDGPPFATGLPHYGHILAGTIKDVVTRYAHQTGHHVNRRFGWDCHGLPIEFEIDKELGIKSKEDVMALPGGLREYNSRCRAIVMRYSSEWETRVTRMGRWIDFKNDYKTLDRSYMESVWWVFGQLYEKKYVFRGFKVMPYSTHCATPLSNFEAGMDYRLVKDPEIVVKFPVEGEENTYFVAWTTTPWTIPSNLALCVNPTFDYVKVKDAKSGEMYYVCKARISQLYPGKGGAKPAEATQEPEGETKAAVAGSGQKKNNRKKTKAKPAAGDKEEELKDDRYTVLETVLGSKLEGRKYSPPFDYFAKEKDKAFRVITGDFVTNDSGTGIVHCSPAFGEEDYNACLRHGVINRGEAIACPIDDNGRFTDEVPDFKGQHVKAADDGITALLKTKGRLYSKTKSEHSYPYCWRSGTPLIYRAVPSWFIRVEEIKQKLLKNNDSTYWVPDHVKSGRFHNWLEDAKDWAVSRNRYWGTPIPIWMNKDDFEDRVCISSVAMLEQLAGLKVDDLHRENIDHITIPSTKHPGQLLHRVEEVFDCWFESGSMPYAQLHYPFENKELFEKTFPADFIAEGIDQTRGWFYTLLVLSTALFDKPAWKNIVVNGLVLAADGKKMSKSLKNYPEPMDVVRNYGADSVRLYLITSPVVNGQDLKFQEEGVQHILQTVFLPWFNSFRFFHQGAGLLKDKTGHKFKPSSSQGRTNIMDKWILSTLQSLLVFVKAEMACYRLFTVIPRLVSFIGQLTNWYIRFNRKRLKGREGDKEQQESLSALFETLLTLNRMMCPFTPFFTEYLYQHLKQFLPEDRKAESEDSAHYLMFPEPNKELVHEDIEKAIADMQHVIDLARYAREKRVLPVKYPLKELVVLSTDQDKLKNLQTLKAYISEELNIRDIVLTSEEGAFIKSTATAEGKALGPRLKGDVKKVTEAIAKMTSEEVDKFKAEGKVTVLGHEITLSDVSIRRGFAGDSKVYEASEWSGAAAALVILNVQIDEEMERQGLAREIVNRVQKLRKEAGLNIGDPVETFYKADPKLTLVTESHREYLLSNLLIPLVNSQFKPVAEMVVGHTVAQIGTADYELWITNRSFGVDVEALKKLAAEKGVSDTARWSETAARVFASRNYDTLRENLSKNNKVEIVVDGVKADLVLGKEVFLSADDLAKSKKAK